MNRVLYLVVWHLGKHSKSIRRLAYRKSWPVCWGILQWLRDIPPPPKEIMSQLTEEHVSQKAVLTKEKLEEFFRIAMKNKL